MVNSKQINILKQGTVVWNAWRDENNQIMPDLREADLLRAHLSGANLNGADLSKANLRAANLLGAFLTGAKLTEADLRAADLSSVELSGANLSGAYLQGASLMWAYLIRANLSGADLSMSKLLGAHLSGTNFSWADLSRANLSGADLSGANLNGADLSGANLSEANLAKALLVETNFEKANLTNCRIYGISAWNLNLNETTQYSLIISEMAEPIVTVDDIEVAQFVYLLINNQKIRNIIDTVTSKVVLILGRFYEKRKSVLDALRDKLREKDYVPVIFDFTPSENRDLTETVQLLANMSKFVIADLTDAKSIPQELSNIVPNLPSVPIIPILLIQQKTYAMFEHWSNYDWVLDEFYYENKDHLLEHLEEDILKPLDNWKAKMDEKKSLKEKIKEKDKVIEELKNQLNNQKIKTQ